MSRELLYFGRFFETSGYAAEARSYVLGLERHGYRIRIETLPERTSDADLIPTDELAALDRMRQAEVDSARAVAIYHQKPGTYRSMGGRAEIARVTFETDRLPAGWAQVLGEMAEVWVPSHFNLQTFAEGGVRPERLRLVRQGIDTKRFHPGARPHPLPGSGQFRFLSAFTWQDRKGWDVLLRAFLTEFRRDEGVELVIWAQPYYRAPEAMREELEGFIRTELRLGPDRAAPVHLLTERCPDAQMPGLYTASDAFVLPSRGEGWGRQLAEAMSCGLPTIGTAWGGNLDFMNAGNSYLIDVERLATVSAAVDVPYFHGHRWAEPSVEHLRRLMRTLAGRPAEAAARAARARAEMAARWDIRTTVGEMASELDRFYGGR